MLHFKSKGYRVFQVVNTIIMILVIFITLYPVIYLVAQSFSSEAAVSAGKVTFYPIDFTTATYKYILRNNEFFLYYWNTIVYSVVGTALSVALTAMLAYPLSKQKLRLNKVLTPFVVFTMYFAGGIIPNFVLVTQWLGLRDSMWAVILPPAISTFNFLLMKSFFAGLPEELEEAAAIDGMGTYGIFLKIVLPLSKAIMAVMALYYAVGQWNSYFNAMIFLQDEEMYPLQLVLREILIASETTTGGSGETILEQYRLANQLKYVSVIVSSLPVIVLYPFVQKYFAQGVMIGSLK